jgi:peptidyl-prolyl cis-trans isomerase D
MAMIEKIRNQQTLLMVVLGIGMVGFLVPFDAVIALMGQGASQEVGSVNGTGITGQEYQIAVQNRRSLGFTGDQLANEVWSDMVSDIVMSDEYSDAGIVVSDKEFQEMLFGDIDSGYMSRAFYSNGDNKRTWVNNFRGMLTTPTGKVNFLRYKEVIIAKRKKEKFDALVKVGSYANSLEGKYDYLGTNRKAEFKYVVKLFKNIPDSAVEVSDRDVRAYYALHKSEKQYKQTEGRDVTLIKIPVGASVGDIDAINTELLAVTEAWGNIEDKRAFAEDDDNGLVSTVRLSQVETNVDESAFFDVNVGSMVGPYTKGNRRIVANILSRKMVPDTAARVRHILLQAKDVKDATEMVALHSKADSLERVIRNGGDFGALAARYSDDPGSKSNGGVYDFFPQGQMVPTFNDFSFNKRIGSIGSVETSYGVHLIEILDRRLEVEEVEVALISRVIAASEDTKREGYTAANEFAIDYSSKEEIIAAAEEAGYTTSEAVNVIRGAKSLSGIRDASELVGWIYNAEVGEISHPILADKSYFVAIIDLAKEDGEPSFEAVEEKMRAGAVKEAKANLYLGLMDGLNLEEIALEIGGSVRTAFNASTNTAAISGSGAGAEPKVVGSAFSIPVGNMSSPIEGNHGVWVIAPQSVTEAEEKTDFLDEQSALVSNTRSGVAISIGNEMREASEVVDSRN